MRISFRLSVLGIVAAAAFGVFGLGDHGSAQAGVNDAPSSGVVRWAGADRFATSAEISAASFAPGVSSVFIASGLSFPDALAGAPVAGSSGGPLLLVTGSSIPAVVAKELDRLNPERIVVLGGSGVIGNAVATQLGKFTDGRVVRWAGADRFATSAEISAASFAPGVSSVFIASG
ncbi:cell wall-binding repeat-containing protein, partial [Agromyces humatus]|uniref:cell wall-binding repeat-containing protein n=1 Tax=Agromyces humatus TaxID=279573 RepID=UPI001E4C7960